MPRRFLARSILLALMGVGLCAVSARAQFGITQSGAGPINRSMAGASTAAPLDASGALYWNPATISGLQQSELEFGSEILYPETRLSSRIPGLGAGSDRGDDGVFIVPSVGLVYKPECSQWTFGMGLVAAGGFGTNYPASRTNPILTAQPPFGVGLGSVYSNFQLLQLVPTASLQLTPHLSVGMAPTVDLANLSADPGVLSAPNPNGQFPSVTHGHTTWGAGFQAGAYYTTDAGWNFGASFKSPQWFEPFRYYTTDSRGRPETLKLHFDYPMIVSVGTAYTGMEGWTFAGDLRFIDYHNANGFQTAGFGANGAVRGLGFDSIFVAAVGAQYQATDALSVRMGYSYNTNPIPNENTLFNAASPVILQHTLYAGASYKVTPAFVLSMAYAHAFDNSITGPLVTPAGPVPGSSVTSQVSADTFMFGATVKF